MTLRDTNPTACKVQHHRQTKIYIDRHLPCHISYLRLLTRFGAGTPGEKQDTSRAEAVSTDILGVNQFICKDEWKGRAPIE